MVSAIDRGVTTVNSLSFSFSNRYIAFTAMERIGRMELPGADAFGRLDRKEAARLLGYSPGTLANWATAGIGPRVHRMRGKVFYLADELRAFALHDCGEAA